MLKDNTKIPYDVVVDDRDLDPYEIWNDQVSKAKTDVVVMSNSDVLVAPGWDSMINPCVSNSIVTGYLVECGAILASDVNFSCDFGKTPSTFRRDAFESFSLEKSKTVPVVKEERGWYMPCAVNRDWFVSTGGFDMSKGSFRGKIPLDIYFWDSCLRTPGFRLLRANSFAYHFQNLSDEKRVDRF
jgi:hypothetical protein